MGQQGIADTERQVPSGGAGALLSWSPQGKRSRQLGAGAAVRGKGFEAGPGLQLPLQEPGAPILPVCVPLPPHSSVRPEPLLIYPQGSSIQ